MDKFRLEIGAPTEDLHEKLSTSIFVKTQFKCNRAHFVLFCFVSTLQFIGHLSDISRFYFCTSDAGWLVTLFWCIFYAVFHACTLDLFVQHVRQWMNTQMFYRSLWLRNAITIIIKVSFSHKLKLSSSGQ